MFLINYIEDFKILNSEEILFFEKLISLLNHNLSKNIIYNILSDKTINFTYNNIQIGRVKLRGKKSKIQILTKNKVEWIEGNFDTIINKLPLWIKYINFLEKNI